MRSTILMASAFFLSTGLAAMPATEAPARAAGKPEPASVGDVSPTTGAMPGATPRRGPRPPLFDPLTVEELAALERKIDEDPESLELRTTALQHYMSAFHRDRERRDGRGRRAHILWLIANAPESELAGSVHAQVNRIRETDLFLEARDLWRQQARTLSRDARVLGNAATFFIHGDRTEALTLYAAAAALEPENPLWPERIAHVHHLEVMTSPSIEPAAAQAALENYERSLALERDEFERKNLLLNLAPAALAAGKDEKAERYAKELLDKEVAKSTPPYFFAGDAIHEGHRVLGHVALRRGDVAGAKSHLLAAGAVTGSPALSSFGPELTLAKDLLAKGEKETVIQYLTSVRRFWRGRDEVIDDWITVIRAGKTPDLDVWNAPRGRRGSARRSPDPM